MYHIICCIRKLVLYLVVLVSLGIGRRISEAMIARYTWNKYKYDMIVLIGPILFLWRGRYYIIMNQLSSPSQLN